MQLIVVDRPTADSPPVERRVPLTEGRTLEIGRGGADITLPVTGPEQVARRQCDIRVVNGVAQIMDYGGSTSALYFAGRVLINGQPLGPNLVWHDLRVGDVIRIGNSELSLR